MTRWTWTAADGSVVELGGVAAWTAGNFVTAEGTGGLLAPEYDFATDSYAGVDGETLQTITPAGRSTILAMDLVTVDGSSLAPRMRALAHALRPRAGIGTLTAYADDGQVRRQSCYYRKGLESATYTDQRVRAALEFWAPSPWWRGDTYSTAWSLAAPTPFFPIPPVVLSASTITGSVSIDLSSTDAPTYALVVVTGPGDQLTMQNAYQQVQPDGTWAPVTQSLVLPVPGGIGDGQLVVVDMRPGKQSVRRATPNPPNLVEQRRNLVPNPRPTSATGYSANYGTGGAGALSYVGSGGPDGSSGYVRATWSTASTAAGSGQLRFDGRASQPLPIPVTPGQVLSGACWARSSVAQRLLAQVTYFDAAGSQTGISPTGHGGTAQVVAADTWTRLAVENVTVPAGAAYALIGPQTVAGTGAVVWPVGATLDQAQTTLELATTAGAYFDGATAAAAGVSYGWAGTAHASQSVLYAVVPSGGYVLGASLFGSLASDPSMFPLIDGLNTLTVTLTNAGAASSIAVAADRLYSGAV